MCVQDFGAWSGIAKIISTHPVIQQDSLFFFLLDTDMPFSIEN